MTRMLVGKGNACVKVARELKRPASLPGRVYSLTVRLAYVNRYHDEIYREPPL